MVSIETQCKLWIQKMIREGSYELVSSYMLRYECINSPFIDRKRAIIQFIDKYADYIVDVDRKNLIEERAQDIMSTGIKFKDACHVASAIFAGCDYFISTDKRLLRYKSEEIKLVSPVEFLEEVRKSL
ncbi:MAG: hypothetical protein SPL59_10675 [Catonella sp.]|nr:hypothetical protein [Catonella sp.]